MTEVFLHVILCHGFFEHCHFNSLCGFTQIHFWRHVEQSLQIAFVNDLEIVVDISKFVIRRLLRFWASSKRGVKGFVMANILDPNPAAESFFKDFLGFEFPSGSYNDAIRSMVSQGKNRLTINADDLRAFDPNTARSFIRDPNEMLPHWEKVLGEVVEEHGDKLVGQPFLAIDGSLGANHVTPRGLHSDLLRQLVMVEGIVTKGKCWASF